MADHYPPPALYADASVRQKQLQQIECDSLVSGYYSSSLQSSNNLNSSTFDISSKTQDESDKEICEPSQKSKFTPKSHVQGENIEALQKVLDKTRGASYAEMLLSYSVISSLVSLPVSAVALARAGFVAIKTSIGIRFGCPECKLVVGEFPSNFDDPKAFHESISPNCPAVQSTTTAQNSEAIHDGTQRDTQIDQNTPNGDQSLFTTTRGASSMEPSSSSLEGAYASAETTAFETLQLKNKELCLQLVEIRTSNHQMRRPNMLRSMSVERNRRKSFKDRHLLDTHITKVYAASGLHLAACPKGKLTLACAWCTFQVDFKREMATDKDVAKELLDRHVMEYHCDFITVVTHIQDQMGLPKMKEIFSSLQGREESMRNIPDLFDDRCWQSLTKHTSLDEAEPGDQLSGFQINYQQAKHTGMAVFERRKDSFLTFPTDSTQQPELLIQAGYFYVSGKSDTVTCFMCGVVSSDWSINETPWQRHARSSPTCQHVISQKGDEFVRSTLEEYGEYRQRKRENRIHNVTTRMLRPRMDSIVVQTALLFGIKRDHIKTVVSNRIMAGDPDFTRLEDLIRAVQDLDVPPSRLHADPAHQLPEVICQPNVRSHSEEEDEGVGDIEEFVTAEFHSIAISDESGAEKQRQLEAKQKQEDLEAIKNFGVDIDIPQLRNQLTCKVCLTEPVGIIYIPCGHFVCCTSCAAAMTHCPMCRKDVNGTIKANFR